MAKSLNEFEESLYEHSVGAARFLSGGSIDPSSRHGSALWGVEKGPNGEPVMKLSSMGANRFAEGVDESDAKRWHDRSWKYKLVSHSEAANIAAAARENIPTEGMIITVPAHPCSKCASMIVEAGIKTVVMDANEMEANDFNRRWAGEINNSRRILEAGGVEVIAVNLKKGQDLYGFVEEELDAGNIKPVQAVESTEHKRRKPNAANQPDMIQAIVEEGEKILKRSPVKGFEQAAIVFNDKGEVLISAENRPPEGMDTSKMSEDEISAFAMNPARIAIARAARSADVSLDGTNLYMTKHPTGQAAAMIASVGIKEVFIDTQDMRKEMNQETAKDIWAGKTILEEAGLRMTFLNTPPSIDPYKEAKEALGDEALVSTESKFRDMVEARRKETPHLTRGRE